VTGPQFLISRFSALGDTVCCLPVASALKSSFPDCTIDWLVDRRFSDVVECCSAVDRVIACWQTLYTVGYAARYELALDLQGLFKSAWPIFWCRADRKLGYHWQREGSWLASAQVKPDPSSLHVVDQYVDVARAAGATADRAEFRLAAPAEDVSRMRERVGDATNLVVINPGAGWVTKRWPAESFAVVCDELARLGATPVLVGGKAPADREAAGELVGQCSSKPISLVGETNIKELIALIGLAKAHLGGDTGSSHIAAALGVPAIGLYSITNPVRSCPYGQIDRCHYDPRGLSSIQPGPVVESIRQVLS